VEGAPGLLLGLGQRCAEDVGGLQAELGPGEADLLLRGADRVVDGDECGTGALVELLGGQPQRVVGGQLLPSRATGGGAAALATACPGDERDDPDHQQADDQHEGEARAAPVAATASPAVLPLLQALGGGDGGLPPLVLRELGFHPLAADLCVALVRDAGGVPAGV